jgi:translation initiation factor 2-alpha kinase 4
MRELTLDTPISVRGYAGSYARWSLFAGRREALWTSYTAEPLVDNSFATTTMPTVTVQVVDFAKHHYKTSLGSKRIDTLVNEINRLKEAHSKHVAQVYAVQRSKSPKTWERLIIVVERVVEGGKLKTWLPTNGFGEDITKVS